MTELKNTVEFCSDKFDDLFKSVQMLTEENARINKKCQELEDKCKKLEKQLNEIEINQEDDKQYSRNHNLIIEDIPDMKNKIVFKIVLEISKKVNEM
ncbi:hypothetical protein ILUMI_03909 [Ignelater luminosus]|uniref:Uncharacterized protein n=1 Tax=Ignelater luminosus TaxID=2038154 RepID=A0A8K0DFC4_IGNLU|nr:hypothetical protein ILUMI_03909 [Ignelater luminosus]